MVKRSRMKKSGAGANKRERLVKVEFDPEKIRKIAHANKHSLHDRKSYYEVVRLFGDQVDSRVRIDLDGSGRWTFWVEGEGTIEEEFVNVKRNPEKFEELLKKGNRMYEKEVRSRGKDPDE